MRSHTCICWSRNALLGVCLFPELYGSFGETQISIKSNVEMAALLASAQEIYTTEPWVEANQCPHCNHTFKMAAARKARPKLLEGAKAVLKCCVFYR